MEITGKVALVTGGARRIGREISLHLARRGADVAVNYLSSHDEAHEVRALIEKLGGRALCIRADISDSTEVTKMVEEAVDSLGRVDILINNAAIFYKTDPLSLSESEWDRFLDINLKGAFLCSQQVARHFMDRYREGGGENELVAGKIVNIADVGGVVGWKGYVPYCVSKAGLIMLTKSMAKALAPAVTVNAVAPGPVMFPDHYTEKEKEAALRQTALKREGSPIDVARAVEFTLESDYVTGEVVFVDGGRQLL